MVKKLTKKQSEAIVEQAMKRFDIATDAWSEVFECALDDIRFVDEDNAQWDETTLDKRKGRPSMTFDKLSGAVDQVIGDRLKESPAVKVRGAEDDDQDGAEIYEGLIRQIEQRGERAYKTGFKFAVKGGYGAWRVRHDYLDATSMDQDIILHEVKNPFSVMVDPIVQLEAQEKSQWGFAFADIPKDDFEDMYPKAVSSNSEEFKTTGTRREWMSEDLIRVAEYFRLVPKEKTILLLSTGEVVDADDIEPILDELAAKGVTIERERVVKGKQLECYKITSKEVLEVVECIGSFIPLVVCFGKQSNIDGKFVSRGVIRKGKDPQRLYNYERSTYVETVALQPKNPYMATPAMLEGHESAWKNINTTNDPVMLFNLDSGNKPFREAPAQVSPGLLTGLQLSADDIKSTTGIHDASLGARSNETSGRAINARKLQGETSTYEFTDELIEAIKYTGRIYVEWIPLVYDATRQIRILGEDDTEEVMSINKPEMDLQSGEEVIINDLSRGRYDLKVTSGPSYSTRRVETAEQLAAYMAQNQQAGTVLGDIYMKTLDIVGADDAHDRLRTMGIKQGFIEPTDEEKQELMAKQPPPNPLADMVQKLEMGMKQAELAKKSAEVDETKSKTQLNSMKAAELRFDMQTGQLVANSQF